MSPALRLASILITQRNMLPVFDHIANGMVVSDAQGEMYIAKGSLEGTDLGHAYVQQVFTHMASNLYVEFPPIFAPPGQHPQSERGSTAFQYFQYNSLAPPKAYLITTTTTTGEKVQREVRVQKGTSYINLRMSYLNYFEHTWHTDTPAGQLQSLFKFATVLMHELTHAFADIVENIPHEHDDSSEPRFQYESQLQELGFEWEKWFFNDCHMTDPVEAYKMQHSQPLLPMEILMISHHDQTRVDPNRTILWFRQASDTPETYLTAKVIRMWFLKHTWAHLRNGRNRHHAVLSEANRSKLTSDQNGLACASYDDMTIARLRLKDSTLREGGFFTPC